MSGDGISREMIEEFFCGAVRVAPDIRHSSVEDRFLAIGKTREGRAMVVAFTLRLRSGTSLIRPISARFMREKELKRYEQAFAKVEE